MEILAFIPVLIMFVIYIGIIGLCVWFLITFMRRQKERNEALRDIAQQLKNIQIVQKEE